MRYNRIAAKKVGQNFCLVSNRSQLHFLNSGAADQVFIEILWVLRANTYSSLTVPLAGCIILA